MEARWVSYEQYSSAEESGGLRGFAVRSKLSLFSGGVARLKSSSRSPLLQKWREGAFRMARHGKKSGPEKCAEYARCREGPKLMKAWKNVEKDLSSS